MKKPYCKWYARDWLGDPLVRMLTPAERGIWMDLLCAMMLGSPYGHLAVNGKPMADEDLARMTGTLKDTLKDTLNRILELGVASKTPEGVMFCRRLIRDYAAFRRQQEDGQRGGNPELADQEGNSSEARIQKPEAIDQNPEARSHTSLKGTLKDAVKGVEFSGDFLLFWEAYPLKVGKLFAWKAWNKAPGRPPIDNILKAVDTQKKWRSWTKEGGEFIPNPSTWLNQGRWDDQRERVHVGSHI